MRDRMSKWDSRGWLVSAVMASLAVLISVGGCLPGFEGGEDEGVSVPVHNFARLHSSGFTPPQGSCMGSTGEMKLRVALMDDRLNPLLPGVELGSEQNPLQPDEVRVETHNTALAEVDAAEGCNEESCSDGFSCQLAPGLDAEEGDSTIWDLEACVREDAWAVDAAQGSLSFISDTENDQVFGLIAENAGSLSGWNPPGTDGAWDGDGDGTTELGPDEAPNTSGADEDIATDPRRMRYTAAVNMTLQARQVAEAANKRRRKTFLGLWSFNSNTSAPRSHVEEVNPSPWTDEPESWERAAQSYADDTTAERSRANVYETLKTVLSSEYDTAAMAELGVSAPERVDKVLAVFVDGVDDLRENDNATIDEVIELANQNNVRLFIVHLDARLEKPELRREDSEYFLGQTPCSDDSECKNYERCRLPRGYAAQAGDPVDSIPADYQDNTYCLPEYDEDGRIGPVHDYARLACSTGGGYIYARSALALPDKMAWLPATVDGLWEATVTSQSLERGEVPRGQALRVHGELLVSVEGRSEFQAFSKIGDFGFAGGDDELDAADNRGVVFAAP